MSSVAKPAPQPSKPRATYEDLCAVPSHRLAQIVDGELIVQPRPALEHAHVSSVLGMDLGSSFQRGRGGPGGWWIVDEPELHIGDHVLIPDLAGWRRERLPNPPRGPHTSLAPDWVAEVLSHSTAGLDRVRKLPIYASFGVEYLWLVDPGVQTLESYRRQAESWLLLATYGDTEKVRVPPFDAVELDLGTLWPGPPEA